MGKDSYGVNISRSTSSLGITLMDKKKKNQRSNQEANETTKSITRCYYEEKEKVGV